MQTAYQIAAMLLCALSCAQLVGQQPEKAGTQTQQDERKISYETIRLEKGYAHFYPATGVVSLNNQRITTADMHRLARLKPLYMNLGQAPEGVEVAPDAFRLLPLCNSLDYLSICKHGLNDADMEIVSQMTQLTELCVEGDHVRQQGLVFGVTDLTEGSIDSIVKLKALEALSINVMMRLSDEFVSRLTELPKLTDLALHSDSFTDKTVDTILTKMKLTSFTISSRQFSPEAIARLKASEGIKTLMVNVEQIRIGGVAVKKVPEK